MRFHSGLRYDEGMRLMHVAPWITLGLLVLLFFLFVSGFCALPGFSVATAGFQGQGKGEPVRVSVAEDGLCRVRGEAVSVEQLRVFLAEVAFRDPVVVVKASRKLPLASITSLWQVCREAGIRRVTFLTD